MLSVFICHSQADEAIAHELAVFLRRGVNLQVFLAEGMLRSSAELLAKVREGTMADAELVLLSPHSAPERWRREEWIPAIWEEPQQAGTEVAVLRIGECRVPDLLCRKNFFDLTTDPVAGFRAVKAWLLALRAPEPVFRPADPGALRGRDEQLDLLRRALGDEPGCAVLKGASGCGKTALALALAARASGDFESLVWLNCGHRKLAGAAGDLAEQLGLRLEAPTQENCARLRGFLAERRFLLVLDDVGSDSHLELIPGGWTSTLITTRRAQLCPEPGLELALAETFHAADPAELDEAERRLIEAMAVCAPGASLELPAALASLEPAQARKVADALVQRGLLLTVDEARQSYSMTERVRRAALSPAWRSRHAALVSRSRLAGLADIERALNWASEANEPDNWELTCELARHGCRQARAAGRLAEAHEFMQAAFEAARRRQDHKLTAEFAWELFWIAQAWGWDQEAQHYYWHGRTAEAGQLVLPLGAEPL